MNKELIKTYFEEFKHWLNGGNIQVYYKLDNILRWWTDKEFMESCNNGNDNFSHMIKYSLEPKDVLIIIDDEYIEFRKALAEGKIVEYSITDLNRNHIRWVNVLGQANSYNIDTKVFNYELSAYRVKPERHKFKKGDWVIYNGEYKRVTKAIDGYIDSLDNQVAVIMKEESLELWKPKINEYFWYKNDLVKFDKTPTNAGVLLQSIRGCSYYPSEDFEDFCEPFIGQLPTILKD